MTKEAFVMNYILTPPFLEAQARKLTSNDSVRATVERKTSGLIPVIVVGGLLASVIGAAIYEKLVG